MLLGSLLGRCTIKSIARWLVAAADLAEAEGRLFRHYALRFAFALGLVLIAAAACLAALALLAWAVWLLLLPAVGEVWARAIVGIVLLGVAVAGGVMAWRVAHDPIR